MPSRSHHDVNSLTPVQPVWPGLAWKWRQWRNYAPFSNLLVAVHCPEAIIEGKRYAPYTNKPQGVDNYHSYPKDVELHVQVTLYTLNAVHLLHWLLKTRFWSMTTSFWSSWVISHLIVTGLYSYMIVYPWSSATELMPYNWFVCPWSLFKELAWRFVI